MALVGSKLRFENERIRVWEFTLQAGESIDAHQHEHDYFFYPIEGGTLEVTRASGVTDNNAFDRAAELEVTRASGVVCATLEAGNVY